VVETNVHYPTDSSLLADGARVLTRLMKQAREKVGGMAIRVRDRMRSVRRKVVAIAVSSGARGRKETSNGRNCIGTCCRSHGG
jgi:IS5 family transposase